MSSRWLNGGMAWGAREVLLRDGRRAESKLERLEAWWAASPSRLQRRSQSWSSLSIGLAMHAGSPPGESGTLPRNRGDLLSGVAPSAQSWPHSAKLLPQSEPWPLVASVFVLEMLAHVSSDGQLWWLARLPRLEGTRVETALVPRELPADFLRESLQVPPRLDSLELADKLQTKARLASPLVAQQVLEDELVAAIDVVPCEGRIPGKVKSSPPGGRVRRVRNSDTGPLALLH